MKLPIGDVIMYGVYKSDDGSQPIFMYKPQSNYTHLAQSQLWWVSEEDIPELLGVCSKWTSNGFKLCIGETDKGTKDLPEVIKYEWQERRHGNKWTVSTHGDEALAGYKLVWLELTDTEKAYEYMREHTDIPVAVKCDINDYAGNDRYRQVFDIANGLFIYYYVKGRPKDIDVLTLRDEDIYDI